MDNPGENDWGVGDQGLRDPADGVGDWGLVRPPAVSKPKSEVPMLVLNIVGMVVFGCLQFMFFYMVAFFAVVWGFCNGASRGHK